MACNFINVGKTTACKENYSGVGSKFYLFDEATGVGTVADSDDAPEFTSGSFTGVAKTIKIKSQSGKVTASSNPNGGGFNNVYTCVVPNDMETMSALAQAMNNRSDWGIMVPTGQTKTVVTGDEGSQTTSELDEFIVLYSKDYDIEFSMESDSGDAPDSDHGHTLTITQSNMIYALQKWYGTIQ